MSIEAIFSDGGLRASRPTIQVYKLQFIRYDTEGNYGICICCENGRKQRISERNVRNYCANSRIVEAKLIGKSWYIPENIAAEIRKLLAGYNALPSKTVEDIVAFYVVFERIHPFRNGNGCVDRLILFKECLKNDIVPFIIEDNLKLFCYRGLKEWDYEKGFLMDTCLTAQNRLRPIWISILSFPK